MKKMIHILHDSLYLFSKFNVKKVKRNFISINYISHNRKLKHKYFKGKVYEIKIYKYIDDEGKQKITKKRYNNLFIKWVRNK